MPEAPTKTEAEVVAQLAQEAVEPTALDSLEQPHLVVHSREAVAEVLDLERFMPEPRRVAGVYNTADVASFVDYITAFAAANVEGTTIWVDQPSASIIAILNDAAPDTPAWRDHRAQVSLTRTPEWNLWLSHDGQLMRQEAFAEHIQEGITEITDPPGADMLEIAQSIQGKTDVDWKAASRVDNGAIGLQYAETIEAKAGRDGKLEIPDTITLGIAPYIGEEPFEVKGRIRYRVKDGALTIGYKLDRPSEVERAVLEDIITRLKAQEIFKHVYLGAAPQPA